MKTTVNNLITGLNYTDDALKHLNNKMLQYNLTLFDEIELHLYNLGVIHNIESVESNILLLSGEYGEPLIQVRIA